MNTISIITILISAFCLLLFFVTSSTIMYRQRDNPNYERTNTVKWFNAVFLAIAASDIVIVSYFRNDLDVLSIAFFFSVRAIISIITAVIYFNSIGVFSRKEIAVDKVVEVIESMDENIRPDIYQSFKSLEISPRIKNELITNLKKIDDSRSDNKR